MDIQTPQNWYEKSLIKIGAAIIGLTLSFSVGSYLQKTIAAPSPTRVQEMIDNSVSPVKLKIDGFERQNNIDHNRFDTELKNKASNEKVDMILEFMIRIEKKQDKILERL